MSLSLHLSSPVHKRYLFERIIHTHIIQRRGNIQINGTYNNNYKNVATTSVRSTLNNTQNTHAAGGKQREEI
jgi:hypothetical protein